MRIKNLSENTVYVSFDDKQKDTIAIPKGATYIIPPNELIVLDDSAPESEEYGD